MPNTCSICNMKFKSAGVTIKGNGLLCPNCAKSIQRMLGDPVPIKDFTPSELLIYLADPSTCPPTAPYYKKMNDNGCVVCGRFDTFIGRYTKDRKPLCKDCVQNYATVSSEYFMDPTGFSAKHDAAYFEEVLKDCVRPRHDIIFNFSTKKLFIMQTNSNTSYRLLNFTDVKCIDNGFQRYDIRLNEKNLPEIDVYVNGEKTDLDKSPAITVLKPGSGFRYEGEKCRRSLKVTLTYKGESFFYIINDSTDMGHEFDKTFGNFLRLVRELKAETERALLEEQREKEREEEEIQRSIKFEEEQNAMRQMMLQEKEARKKAAEELQKGSASANSGTSHRIGGSMNAWEMMHQRSSMTSSFSNIASQPAGNKDYSSLVELRKLFDAGIITEEEFTAKKKQILGI